MAKIRLFIDLGSFRTVIFREDKGIVLNEPTKVLYEKINDKNVIVEYGRKAIKLDNLSQSFVVSPVLEGCVVDEIACASMLREYLRRVITDKPNASIEAYMTIPCGTVPKDKEKYFAVGYTAGISDLYLIPTPIADMFGCGVSFDDFEYCLFVDIGSGCTDIAILGDGGIVQGFTINVGAVSIDLSIINHIQSKYGVKISLQNAVSLKEQIGSLIPDATKILTVSGVDRTDETKIIKVTGFDILDALREYYQVIADSILGLLAETDMHIVSKISDRGIVFCGNGSKIDGLQEYMTQRLNFNIYISCEDKAVFGLRELSKNKKLVKKYL